MNKKQFKRNQGKASMLTDTHRKIPKAQGGEYTASNTELQDPVDHMIIHGNLRVRNKELTKLKSLMDDRKHVLNMRNKMHNQILAMHRGVDHLNRDTENFLQEQLESVNKLLNRKTYEVKQYIKTMEHPVVKAAQGVRGLGEISLAYLLCYIDIEKADQASGLVSYCGYHIASHKRYVKGTKGGGNKILRTALYNMGMSMIKNKSPYKDIYDDTKLRLSGSQREVETYNTKGVLVVKPWCDTKPSHRHGAALRKMIKHFLRDFWLVWRTVEDLPTRPLYVEEYQEHKHITKPEERGWIY